jgi:hypothetical protein
MDEVKFAEGLYFKEPNEKAPEWVKGKLSIQKQKLTEWLANTPANEKGYINLDIKVGRSGKPYIAIDTWEPSQQQGQQQPQYTPEQQRQMDTPIPTPQQQAPLEDPPF